MNRIYKVIWNEALNCFTAVGEYAKGRGKSSKSSVSANTTISTTPNLSSTNAYRLTAIGLGLLAAGLTMSPQVLAATGVGGGVGIGTANNCSTAASAGKTNSVAVGCNSVADLSSDPAVTFYQRNNPDNTGVDTFTAFNSTAIGTGAVATEAGTSLGMNASSSNLGVALGIQSKSENVAAIAIGPAALAKGNTSLALGRQSAATEDFAQAIGNVSSATGKGSLAMGHSARAEGYRSIAIGSADIKGADATGTQSGVVYQTNEQTLAKGKDSMAFGSGAQSLLEDSVALGSNSTANVGGNVGGYVPTGVNGTAILATKSTTGAVSVGRVASRNKAAVRRQIVNLAAGANDSDAVNVSQLKAVTDIANRGWDISTQSDATTASTVGPDDSVDFNSKNNNITVSKEATSNNVSFELNDNLDLGRTGSVEMGSGGALGLGTTVDGLGVRTGNRFVNTNVSSLGVAVSTPFSKTLLSSNGLNIIGGPSVTKSGGINAANRKVVNVDDGIQAKDAVNVSQLEGVKEIANKGWEISTQGIATTASTVEPGDSVDFNSKNSNIIVSKTADSNDISFELNNQLDLGGVGSIQIGNTFMDNRGFTFIDSRVMLSSRGLDNGGNTIRNVGKGVLNTDAVNVGQLKGVAIALDQGWGITAQGDIATMVKQGDAVDLSSKDGNIKVSRKSVSDVAALDGSPSLQAAAIPTNANDISFDLNPDITLNSVTTGDTIMNDNGLTIAGGPSITKSGIDAADTNITNVQNGEVSAESQDAINGSQLYAQGAGISSIIGGDTVYNAEDGTFTNSDIGGTGESNIDGAIASIRQGTIEISENVQINTESITTNTTNIATNTTNIATNTSSITTNTTNIKTNADKLDAGLNFGADSGANINKPIGDGSVLSFTGGNNITTTSEGSSIKFDLNGNISVDSVTVGTTVINSEGISMQDGPSMTSQGLYAGNQRMTGVADGVEATDAVNYSQLSALDSRLNNNMSDLGYKIDEVEDDANAGISAAMAMSAMPQAYIAGKSLIGGGIGTYNGESAVAIGFSKLSNDGRWVIKVNGSADTQGNVGGAVGAGFHFD